ncbi:hypothetical protein P9578_08220 [Brevibacillus choshinensis]|uniref:hypothetical protein n=1 Tax=Brevibacillus choshinensis TaxID=54911 RepID=UPI002E1F647C|nr:hypothetical protein [Brevibacillus choshinensis]
MKQQEKSGANLMAEEAVIRKVLLMNAVSSGACGLLLLLFPGYIADWMGLDNRLSLIGTGVFLLVVVAFLSWAATRSVISPRVVLVFSILDFLWVIDSLLLLVGNGSAYTITLFGMWAIILVAAVVGVFAICEAIYWWYNRPLASQKQHR